MGYIGDIRKKVGHDEIIIVGATVIVYRDGQTLLQRRRDNGCWGTHGGCAEIGENTEAAAKRELYEETGLTAGKMTMLGVYSGEDTRYTYPNGDRVSVVDIVYVCEDFSGEIKAQKSEVTALKWFRFDEIPPESEISPLNRRPLADFIAREKKKTEIARKLSVLVRVAKALNEQNVFWALGASGMLYLRGVTDDFHDLDLMISAESVEAAREALDALGDRQPAKRTRQFETECFLEYIVDGVDVDCMANMTILFDGEKHVCPLTKQGIERTVVLDGENIPLSRVSDWREYYRLMGRDQKVRLIDQAHSAMR